MIVDDEGRRIGERHADQNLEIKRRGAQPRHLLIHAARATGDIPVHQTILVSGATQGPGPFNAKPAAEHAITPVPAAVVNAVYNATGVRITELPVTAEKVRNGLLSRHKA